MSEAEFVAWCDEDTRAEWVNGEVRIMSPATGQHVDLNWWIGTLLRLYVEHHDLGMVRGPEFQIRLGHVRRVPDVLYVSGRRLSSLHRTYFDGAPDLAVEIVSPDSEARDWREKYLEYQAAGVREYWVIDPNSEHMEVYRLVGKAYRRIEEKDGRIASAVLRGLYIKPAWLWAAKPPKLATILKELGVS